MLLRRLLVPGGRLRRFLLHRHLPLLLALLGVLLVLPSLRGGFQVDDLYHRVIFLGQGNHSYGDLIPTPWRMFTFFTGDPVRTKRLRDLGLFPWWSHDTVKAEFFRPLTVVTHKLDYALWPNSAPLMHFHSILWYGLLVGLVATLYRRLEGPGLLAGVAALLWAVDDAHGFPVGFLANRNALICCSLGVLCLMAHHRWRRNRRIAFGLVGWLLLAGSLLAKEAGIATCAYLAAYALILDEGSLRRRLASLVPYGLIVVAWRVVYDRLGFGVANVSFYIDPLTEPLRFLKGMVERIPVLVLGQFAGPSTELAAVGGPAVRLAFFVGGILVTALMIVALQPLLRGDRTARFWALGMVLALVPITTTFPADRLLFFVSLGGMALLSRLLRLLYRVGGKGHPILGAAAGRWLLRGLLLIHLLLSPLVLPFRAAYPMGPPGLVGRLYVRCPLPSSITKRTLVIVNPPTALLACYVTIINGIEGRPLPGTTRILSSGVPGVTVRRLDEHSLAVRPDTGYLTNLLDRIMRAPGMPFRLGERVRLPGMTAEILSLTPDGRPAEVVFRFALPLEDASHYWLVYRDGAFVPWKPIAVGQSRRFETNLLVF